MPNVVVVISREQPAIRLVGTGEEVYPGRLFTFVMAGMNPFRWRAEHVECIDQLPGVKSCGLSGISTSEMHISTHEPADRDQTPLIRDIVAALQADLLEVEFWLGQAEDHGGFVVVHPIELDRGLPQSV